MRARLISLGVGALLFVSGAALAEPDSGGAAESGSIQTSGEHGAAATPTESASTSAEPVVPPGSGAAGAAGRPVELMPYEGADAAPAGVAGPERARELAREAADLVAQGSFAAAEAKASLAVTVAPNVPEGHYQLANIRFRQGDITGAMAAANAALRADVMHMPSQALLLRLDKLRGSSRAAVTRLAVLLQKHPDDLRLKLLTAEARLLDDQHPAAMNLAREALKKAETSVPAMRILARAYDGLGRHEAARAILMRAIELEKDPETMHLLAMLELDRGETLKARGWLEAAVEKNPNYVEALNNLGVVYTRVRNWEAAIDVLERARAQAPAFAAAWLNLGIAQRGARNFEAAEAAWQQALKLDPTMAEAHYDLGILYLENRLEGREREALLASSIDSFNAAKRAGQLDKEQLADTDKYIGEARLLLEQEKKRKSDELKRIEEQQQAPPEDGAASEEEGSDDGLPADEGGEDGDEWQDDGGGDGQAGGAGSEEADEGSAGSVEAP